ncbi:MAG: hypothetical protein FD180_3046 [Planctomycetota bacterium]|nr:MAG: hypothetical protein FD180_3046 [Planctomycetota bacterium]
MKDRLCFYHNTVQAVGMCLHDHKPYCQACEVVTPLGKFCCFDCSGKYAAFKSTWKEPKLRSPWLGPMLAGAVLLLVLGAGAAWAGHRLLKISALEPFDVVTRFTR